MLTLNFRRKIHVLKRCVATAMISCAGFLLEQGHRDLYSAISYENALRQLNKELLKLMGFFIFIASEIKLCFVTNAFFIVYFRIALNTLCLPPKFCITIVLKCSWEGFNSFTENVWKTQKQTCASQHNHNSVLTRIFCTGGPQDP